MVQKIFLTSLILLFISPVAAIGEEPRFQNTASEIINSLNREAPVSTRGLTRTRGLHPTPECRSIVVKERVENQTMEKTVTIYPDQLEPHANLKIEFDVNSYRIRPEAYKLLNELGMALCSDALNNKSFYINGHTDSDGPWEYNMDLSVNRAQSVKDFLVGNYNIPAQHLKVMGYGEAVPLMDNTTAVNKQANRRVEIKRVD